MIAYDNIYIYKCCNIFINLLSAWSVAAALVFHAPHLPGSCRRVARFLGGCANHWGNYLKSAKNIEQMWKVSKNIQDGQPLFWPLQFSIFQLPLFLLDALDSRHFRSRSAIFMAKKRPNKERDWSFKRLWRTTGP